MHRMMIFGDFQLLNHFLVISSFKFYLFPTNYWAIFYILENVFLGWSSSSKPNIRILIEKPLTCIRGAEKWTTLVNFYILENVFFLFGLIVCCWFHHSKLTFSQQNYLVIILSLIFPYKLYFFPYKTIWQLSLICFECGIVYFAPPTN